MQGRLPATSRPARLEASQGAEGLPSAPFGMAQRRGYPSMYPLPGLPQPPLAFPPNVGLHAMPLSAFGAYRPNHAPTLQFRSSVASPDFTPVNNAHLWSPHYPFYGTLGQDITTSSTTLQASRATGLHMQSAAPATFQSPLPTQPGMPLYWGSQHHRRAAAQEDLAVAAFIQDANTFQPSHGAGFRRHPAPQVVPQSRLPSQPGATLDQLKGQHRLRVAQEDFAVEKPNATSVRGATTSATTLQSSQSTGHQEQSTTPVTFQSPLPTQPEAPRQGQHRRQVSQKSVRADKPPKEPEQAHREDVAVNLDSYQLHTLTRPPEGVHTCFNDPDRKCPGGTICINVFKEWFMVCPGLPSPEQLAEYIAAGLVPELDLAALADLLSQAENTNLDPSPSKQSPSSWETASSSSSTLVTSASTSVYTSPAGSSLAPPDHQAIASSSTSSGGRAAGKRQRSEDCPEDHPKKQQRKKNTDTQGEEGHCTSEQCNTHATDCKEKRPKKKKRSDDEVFICIICLILGKTCRPLSRKDALKRHIVFLHEILMVLCEHEEFDILQPRRMDRLEDLAPFIERCVLLQLQAKQRGEKIEQDQDLTILYPQVAAAVAASLHPIEA